MGGQKSRNWKLALVDLDGTLYRGHETIPGADEFVGRLRRRGIKPVFFTNNATRTPEQVCSKLSGFGISCVPEEVCTSAQGAAAHLARRAPAQTNVIYLGTTALKQALLDEGLTPYYAEPDAAWPTRLDPFGDGIGAAVLGLDFQVNYSQLSVFTHYVMKLGWFVLTNGDVRLPAGAEFLPGNGALGKFVETASGVQPVITGKPEIPFVEYALERYGVNRDEAVIIGDNLFTDILAGSKAGVYTILVQSGVQYKGTDLKITANETYDSVDHLFLEQE